MTLLPQCRVPFKPQGLISVYAPFHHQVTLSSGSSVCSGAAIYREGLGVLLALTPEVSVHVRVGGGFLCRLGLACMIFTDIERAEVSKYARVEYGGRGLIIRQRCNQF